MNEDKYKQMEELIETQKNQITSLKDKLAEQNNELKYKSENYEIELSLIEKEVKQKENVIHNLSEQIQSNLDYRNLFFNTESELSGLYSVLEILGGKIQDNSKKDFVEYGLINKYNPNTLEIGDHIGDWIVDKIIDDEYSVLISFIGLSEIKGRFKYNHNIKGYRFNIEDNSMIPVPLEYTYNGTYGIYNMDKVFNQFGDKLDEKKVFRFRINKVDYSNEPVFGGRIILFIDELIE